jgi:hypothetical protein
MEVKPTDSNGSTWSKICVVRLKGVSHAIAHPRDDYALLIDRVKELLVANNIDTEHLLGVYDTNTNLRATKALWELEMHKTGDVRVSLSFESFGALFINAFGAVLAVELALLFTIPLYFYFQFNMNLIFWTLFISVILFGVLKFKFNKFERGRREAAQPILYPTRHLEV